MAYSIMSLGNATRQQAMQGLSDNTNRESAREQQNEQLKTAKKTQVMGAVGTGAAIGTMIMPGVGTAVGAGVGFIAGELF